MFYYEKKENMKIICHLLKFRLDSPKEIKIDEDFKIRKLSSNEIKLLKEKFYPRHQFFYYGLKEFQCCIEFKNKYEKMLLEPVSSFGELFYAIEERHDFLGELNERINHLILAMWLYSGKAVTVGGLLCYDPENESKNAFSLYPESTKGKIWNASKDQIEKFKEFWNVFKKMWFEFHDVAIWYFREAMYAKFIQDKLLKLTIAMDKILTPDGTFELRERFSTRAAIILENELKKRKEKKKFFKSIYDKRSGVVHGGIPVTSNKIKEKECQEYFSECRKLMCFYIENNPGWKEKMQELSLGENKLKNVLLSYLIENGK